MDLLIVSRGGASLQSPFISACELLTFNSEYKSSFTKHKALLFWCTISVGCDRISYTLQDFVARIVYMLVLCVFDWFVFGETRRYCTFEPNRIIASTATRYARQDKTRQDKTTRGHGRRHYSASKSASPMSKLTWQYLLYSTKNSDRSPVPVRLALQSNLTGWLSQNLSKRFLNTSTVSTFTT